MNPNGEKEIYADLTEKMNTLETQIKYPWLSGSKKIQDIPNFPFSSFGGLRDAVAEGTWILDVSYPAARALSRSIRSPMGVLANFALLIAPYVLIIVVIVTAIHSGRYILLLGIPISVIASTLGNPVNPQRNFMSLVNSIAQLGLVIAYWQGFTTTAWFLLSFVVPFFANRKFYEDNLKALRRAAQDCEPLFVDLYEKLAIRLVDKKTNKIYHSL